MTTLHPLFVSGCVKTEEVLSEFGFSDPRHLSVHSACRASHNVSYMFCACRAAETDPNVCNFNELSLALHAEYRLTAAQQLADMLDVRHTERQTLTSS